MNIRQYGYWLLDRARGGRLRRHFADIKNFYEVENEKGRFRRKDELKAAIIRHAIATTSYYAAFDRDADITQFPVMDKTAIRKNLPEMISRDYAIEKLGKAVTSGSTGTPFVTYQDKRKKQRNTADVIYFAERAGFSIGEDLFYLKIWSDLNKKSILIQKLQNVYPIDVLNLASEIDRLLSILNRRKKINFLGYSSALETLLKSTTFKDNISPKLKVNSIIAMSESLDEKVKKEAEEVLKCKALSRYSNIENGIIAQETLDIPESFLLNEASYCVEILDPDSDQLVPEGELGRIVVTDYFNYGMPLIRYDTGDIGAKGKVTRNENQFSVLKRVEGRKLDQIYNTKGDMISPYIVYKNMWKYTEIEQYQFVQSGQKEYRIKLNTSKNFDRETEMRKEFRTYLGDDAEIGVEFVNEIPLLDSGKRKKVVNLCSQ